MEEKVRNFNYDGSRERLAGCPGTFLGRRRSLVSHYSCPSPFVYELLSKQLVSINKNYSTLLILICKDTDHVVRRNI